MHSNITSSLGCGNPDIALNSVKQMTCRADPKVHCVDELDGRFYYVLSGFERSFIFQIIPMFLSSQ